MKRITYCGVAQSPYNDFLLTEVNKSFDLKVYYQRRKMNTHPWDFNSVDYKYNYIKSNLFEALKRILSSDIVMISGWAYWQHLVIMIIPMKSKKKIYWTDTVNLNRKEWIGFRGFIRRIIVKIVFHVFDEVWSTGKPGCEALEKLGCKKTKIKSFPFFLDLSLYTNIDTEKYNKSVEFKSNYVNDNTEIIFLSIGQLIARKRFGDSIKALALLNDERAVLWIVGSGTQEHELKGLAHILNVSNRVKFIGWIQQKDVELALISSDVFIHPSEFDPFPTVVLDAMTMAKPIIGTKEAGSVRDRVKHGTNGLIYSSGQIEMLAEHMRFFIENKEEIMNYGLESRFTACNHPIEDAIEMFKQLV
jgi:glycosyltransferase involved in cell wall biosynthesis